jgi:LmbE family N-acetylglucosaminyl deacetylase
MRSIGSERARNLAATVVNWTTRRSRPRILEVRILCIGAHPDDCEIGFGGTAAKFAALGHAVKFISMTDGSAGHFLHRPETTAAIRGKEAAEAARRLGIASAEVLSYRDGELTAHLEVRHEIVRQIRAWRSDVVLTHRPWDYHPDHRYTSQIVQDSAYLVTVPHVCPETEELSTNPVFLYMEDPFRLPAPFVPDIAVEIEWMTKLDALDAHVSQFYEWLPWMDRTLDSVPKEPSVRRQWLAGTWKRPASPCTAAALARRYGSRTIEHAEAFQVCEYGRQPAPEDLDEIFPR